MNIRNRIARLEKWAEKRQGRIISNSFVWADAPPIAESIAEWEAFVRWQQGKSDGSDLRREYRQACEAFFERAKSSRVLTPQDYARKR